MKAFCNIMVILIVTTLLCLDCVVTSYGSQFGPMWLRTTNEPCSAITFCGFAFGSAIILCGLIVFAKINAWVFPD